LKVVTVDLECGERVLGHEVMREREGQSELCGEPGAKVAGAEQPDRGRVTG